jgi:hypothetical protein
VRTGKEPLHIILHAGTYYLQHPLVFTDADSGSKEAPRPVVLDRIIKSEAFFDAGRGSPRSTVLRRMRFATARPLVAALHGCI